MKLRSGMKQFIVFLLAFLMAFEPFAVNMVYANSGPDADNPEAEITTPDADLETFNSNTSKESVNKINEGLENADDEDADSILKPADYLKYMYNLRGKSEYSGDAQKLDNAFAWGEWMNTISGAYATMDDGCNDVFTFYGTLGNVLAEEAKAELWFKAIGFAVNKAALAGVFIAKATGLAKLGKNITKWITAKKNLMKGLNAINRFYSKGLNNAKVFITHISPPTSWKGAVAGQVNTVSYWRWVARKTGLENSPKYVENVKKLNSHLKKENQICTNKGSYTISNAKGVATTIGIGLTVVGIAIDSYNLFASNGENHDDLVVGRVSYPLVKTCVSLILGVGSLVAMFCIPIVGQIIGAIALIWTAITAIADQFGEYNKKWKAAYKNSYWFLYQNDPEFKSYYDNRDDLVVDEKSAAYIMLERNYGDQKAGARSFEQAHKGDNSYYDDKSQEAVNARVYIEMEKQGVVTSYYNRRDFKLQNFETSRLYEMWNAKADYMSWKPTEEESTRAANRGFWGKIGHALNPMTYVSWIGDKVKSRAYNKLTADGKIDKVYFNPDYVLIKKYQTWITSNRIIQAENAEGNNNDFYRAIGLRIEQAPFNYMPLVDTDLAFWNDELLLQAFKADAFFVGVKEMMYFRNMISPATKQVKEFTKQVTKEMKEIRKALDYFGNEKKGRIEALNEVFKQYDYSPDSESAGKDLLKNKAVKKAFGWKWNDSNGKKTPRNIVKVYWNDINLALTIDPLSISQNGANIQLMLDTIKKNLDMGVLMNELYEEKLEALENFEQDFTNLGFNAYLKENKLLDNKMGSSGILDWLSGISPAYKELEKYNKLYKKEIDKYAKAAEDSNTGHNSFWFITWDDEDNHPNKVLNDINSLLDRYKELVGRYENLASKLSEDGLTLSGVSSEDSKVYTKYQTVDTEASQLDPTEEIPDDIGGAPTDAEKSAMIPD